MIKPYLPIKKRAPVRSRPNDEASGLLKWWPTCSHDLARRCAKNTVFPPGCDAARYGSNYIPVLFHARSIFYRSLWASAAANCYGTFCMYRKHFCLFTCVTDAPN